MNTTDWAVFTDEGCLESHCTKSQSMKRAAEMVADGDPHAYAARECPDHPEEPADTCELCNTDEIEDEE